MANKSLESPQFSKEGADRAGEHLDAIAAAVMRVHRGKFVHELNELFLFIAAVKIAAPDLAGSAEDSDTVPTASDLRKDHRKGKDKP